MVDMKYRWIRIVSVIAGLCLLAPAFFLPAIKMVHTGPGPDSEAGWVCAVMATASLAGIFKGSIASATPDILCLMLSGLVNPLMLVYLVFCLWRKFFWVRLGLAIVILAGIASSWEFFYLSHFTPTIGHFLWVGGILVILAGEFAGRPQKRIA